MSTFFQTGNIHPEQQDKTPVDVKTLCEDKAYKNSGQLTKAIYRHDHELLIQLLNQGCNPNYAVDRLYPLMIAVILGDSESVTILLAHGANLNLQEIRYGHTALMIACIGKQKEIIIQLLESFANPKCLAFDKSTILHLVCYGNDDNLLSLFLENQDCLTLVNAGTNDSTTPLMIACAQGNIAQVQALLKAGADPALMNNEGANALILACQNKHPVIVKQLLEHSGISAVINNPDINGSTPLFWSMYHSGTEVFELLLKHSANLKQTYEDGNTLLHLACLRGFEKCIAIILQQKEISDLINLPNKLGETPLICLMKNNLMHDQIKLNIAKKMIASGAMTELSQDVKLITETAFLYACENGNIDSATFLCDNHANITRSTRDGKTALHLACENQHIHIINWLFTKKEIQEIINAGTEAGATALMLAIENNAISTVKLLVSYKANIDQKDNIGKTAFMLACELDLIEIAKFLRNSGANTRMTTIQNETAAYFASANGSEQIVHWLLKSEASNTFCLSENLFGLTPRDIAYQNHHNGIVTMIDSHQKEEYQNLNNSFNKFEKQMVRLFITQSTRYQIYHETIIEQTPLSVLPDCPKLMTTVYSTKMQMAFKNQNRENVSMVITNFGNTHPGTLRLGMRMSNNKIFTLTKLSKYQGEDFCLSSLENDKLNADQHTFSTGEECYILAQYGVFKRSEHNKDDIKSPKKNEKEKGQEQDKALGTTQQKANVWFLKCTNRDKWIEDPNHFMVLRK